jgi:hypothetical protein
LAETFLAETFLGADFFAAAFLAGVFFAARLGGVTGAGPFDSRIGSGVSGESTMTEWSSSR